MKNYSQKLFLICLVAFLSGCSGNNSKPGSSRELPSYSEISSEEISSEMPEPVIKSLLPEEGTYTRFTDYQKTYLESEDYADTTPFSGTLTREDVSYPVPIEFSWEVENLECSSYSVDIYKINEGQNDELKATYLTAVNSFKFYNTEVGASYKYKVTALDEENNEIMTSDFSPVFSTENKGPRHLYVPGVENMRDLGGWGKIKQGMIYRSGRFNEDKTDEPTLTVAPEGVEELARFGIKTEIDLRRTANNEVGGLTNVSVIPTIENYYQIPMLFEGKNLLTYVGKSNSNDGYAYDNPAAIKRFFELLADENNYPISFHCSIGKDRTGCLAFLLEGLMGFDLETMYRDYMFTNFSKAGYCKLKDDILDRYGKTLDEYENGDNINEKIYNYLNEIIGVSIDDLNSIKTILGA